MRKNIISLIITVLLSMQLFSSHFVGGDFCVKQIGPSSFEVTLRIFRDCNPGNSTGVSPSGINVYEENTNTLITTFDLSNSRISIDTIPLGDACYTPTGLCVEEQIFRDTITLVPNTNGYYFTWDNCCRNSIIDNLDNPGSAGITYYIAIPDPALPGGNSSPCFGPYPTDGYLCINNDKQLDFGVTDPDGDSLVFSLITPFDDGLGPKPIPLITWTPGFSLANILGPGSAMTIDPQTGIITARPALAGVYVFSILVEEYRGGVKIGEVVRDVQFQALNCNYDQAPYFPPAPDTNVVIFEGNSCFDIVALDLDPNDSVYISVSTSSYPFGSFITLPDPVGPNQYNFSYLNTNTGNTDNVTAEVYQINDTTFFGPRGKAGIRFCWSPDSCDVLALKNFKMNVFAYSVGCDGNDTLTKDITLNVIPKNYWAFTPNVFSPNGDGKNDTYKMGGDFSKCYDVLNIEIYDRWGKKVYEADDPLFEWNGTNLKGKELPTGTYYVILQGFFGSENVTEQFPVTLFR